MILEKSKLYNLILSFNLDIKNIENIILSLSKNSKYKIFLKEKEVFKYGDPADNFFIIFSGSVKSYKLKKINMLQQKMNYIIDLKKLKDNNDISILKKSISFNSNLEINEYEIDRLFEKIQKIKNIKIIEYKKNYLKLYNENKYENKFEDYLKDIEAGEIHDYITNDYLKSILYESSQASQIEKNDDDRIFDKNLHKIYFFKFEFISVLKEGDYFGESGEKSHDRRYNNYFIPEKDTICLSFSNDLYLKYFTHEFEKLKNKEILFLNENLIFKNIKRGTFVNHYLKYFTKEEFYLGKIIFEEEQNVENLYIIKEGRIEININSNIISLHSYANDLINVDPVISSIFKDFPNIPDIKHQPNLFMDNLKKTKFFSIFILSENDILGLEESYFNFKRLYRTVIKTEKTVVYSIPLKKFRKIIEAEPSIMENFRNYSIKKICNLIKRLYDIKNDHLKIMDLNYTRFCDKKTVVYKNIKNSTFTENRNEKNEIKKYFNEFNDLSKVEKKRYELLLNPQGDQFKFYNDFNYEISAIKNIKKEIRKIKNNSLSKVLPLIKNNYSIFKNEHIYEKNHDTLYLNKINEKKKENFKIVQENNYLKSNNSIYNNISLEDDKNFISKFSSIYFSYDYKKKHLKIPLKLKEINTKSDMFASMDTDGELLNTNSSKNISTFGHESTKFMKIINYSEPFYHEPQIQNNKEIKDYNEINNQNKNCFVPYSVDNSVNGIKNFHKKLQLSVARNKLKFKSRHNYMI